jgi:dTDP-4-dehydrorhamnose 3,5-epimerase
MIFEELPLKGAYTLKPKYMKDNRGAFGRLFCREDFRQLGHEKEILQINHSVNQVRGSVRGMHYQTKPKCEIKIVKCIKGAVFDVIVDLREESATFLQWASVELSAQNQKMIYIPEGFAHGFQVLESGSELLYLHSEYYSPGYEAALNYRDPILGITWPLSPTEVSEKDKKQSFIDEKFKGLNI